MSVTSGCSCRGNAGLRYLDAKVLMKEKIYLREVEVLMLSHPLEKKQEYIKKLYIK